MNDKPKLLSKLDLTGIKEAATPSATPNEAGTFSVEGFIKIFDPNTNEVLVEKRA